MSGAAINPSTDAGQSAPPAPGAQGLPLWARERAMVAARGEGDTLAQIGARFGLTRERVRQILVAHAGPTHTAASRRARAERQWAAAMECRDELLALFRAGLGDQAIARRLGIKHQTVGVVIAACAGAGDKDARLRALQAARGQAPLGDQALLEAVRRATEHAGQVPTSAQYDQIARAEGLPSLSTLTNRLGGWNAAVSAAGLTPAHPLKRTCPPRWSEQACLQALRALVDELGDMPTQARYDLLATQRQDLPSSATLYNRLGRWTTIPHRLQERGEQGVERPGFGGGGACVSS